MDVQVTDFYLLIGIVGALIVGFVANEVVFLSSKVLSKAAPTDGSHVGRHEPWFLWTLRRRYLPLTLSLAPLTFAWVAFGIFYGINVIFTQTGAQTYTLFVWLCATAAWCIVAPVLLLVFRADVPLYLSRAFPMFWVFIVVGVMVWVGLGSRLLLNVPYLSLMFGVVFTVPSVAVYFIASRLWPMFLLRNVYIVAGWDGVTHQTTRSPLGLVSRLLALLRLLLLAVSVLLTLNTLAGLLSGRVVGYFDTTLMLLVPTSLYWVRYIVWVALRIGPVLWLLVQPSTLLELSFASETYQLLASIDYEDVVTRAPHVQGPAVLGRLPPSARAMATHLLLLSELLCYCAAMVASDVLWIGMQPVNGFVSAAQWGILDSAGLTHLSFVCRLGEMLILAGGVVWKCFNWAPEKEMLTLTRLSVQSNLDYACLTLDVLSAIADNDAVAAQEFVERARIAAASYRDGLPSASFSDERLEFLSGLIRLSNKDLDGAETCFQQALAHREDYGDAFFQLGVVLAIKGEAEQAMAALREALKHKGERKLVLCSMGMISFVQHDYRAAVEHFSEALKIDPSFAKVWNKLSELLIEMEDYQEALVAAERALALEPNDAVAKLNLCLLYRRMKLTDKHEELFSALQTQHATDKFVMEKLADMKAREDGDFETAVTLYTRVRSLDGDSRSLLKKLSNALVQTGRKAEAIEIIEGYLATEPAMDLSQELELRLMLAKWYPDADSERAVDQLNYILAHDPSFDPRLHSMLGKRFINLGRLREARDVLLQAFELNHEDADILFYLALVSALLDQSPDNVGPYFERSLTLKWSKYRLGLWMYTRRRANALSPAWIEEVVEYFSQVPVPLSELYAAMAAALHALGDSRQAMRFYEESLKSWKDADLLHDFACLLLQMEGISYAEQALRQSLKLQPDVYALHNLVLALKQQGRENEAHSLYVHMMESNPGMELEYEELDGIAFSDRSLFYLLYNAFIHLDEVRMRWRLRRGDSRVMSRTGSMAAPAARRSSVALQRQPSAHLRDCGWQSGSRFFGPQRTAATLDLTELQDVESSDEEHDETVSSSTTASAELQRTVSGTGGARRTRRLDRLRSATGSEVRLTDTPARAAPAAADSEAPPPHRSAMAGVLQEFRDKYLDEKVQRKKPVPAAIADDAEFPKPSFARDGGSAAAGTAAGAPAAATAAGAAAAAGASAGKSAADAAAASGASESVPLQEQYLTLSRPRGPGHRRGPSDTGAAAAAVSSPAAGAAASSSHTAAAADAEMVGVVPGAGAAAASGPGKGTRLGALIPLAGESSAAAAAASSDAPVRSGASLALPKLGDVPAGSTVTLGSIRMPPPFKRSTPAPSQTASSEPPPAALGKASVPSSLPAAPKPASETPAPRSVVPPPQSVQDVDAPKEMVLNRDGRPVPKAPPPPPDLGVVRRGPPPAPAPPVDLFGSNPTAAARKTKQFHWNKIPLHKLKETIWGQTEGQVNLDLDPEELTTLFEADQRRRPDQPTEHVVRSVLDSRRANNVAITLSKIPLSYAEIRDAILSVDEARLTLENVENMVKVVPTPEEMEAIRSFKGDMSHMTEADRFFAEIVKVPNLAVRLNSFLFKLQFNGQLSFIREQLQLVMRACSETRGSTRFARLLEVILQLGNALNRDAASGGARGFRLDSLLRMMDIKQSNQKATLLHYLVKLVDSRMPDLLTFYSDLPSAPAVVRVSLVALRSEVQALNSSFQALRTEVERVRALDTVDVFAERMSAFVEQAGAELEALNREFATAQEQYGALARYFGEDPTTMKLEDFFGLINNFVASFQKAKSEMLARRGHGTPTAAGSAAAAAAAQSV